MSRASQIFRRACQMSVLAFIVWAAFGTTWRNYKRAHNSSRLVALIHGDAWGEAYSANESLLLLIDEDTEEASRGYLGFPWAGRVANLDTADPILVLAHVLSTGEVDGTLLLALIAPFLLALIFGKVFCSHLCPMRLTFELGERVRRGLQKLRVPLPEVMVDSRFGGWVLLGGAIATVLSSTAIWYFLLPYVALSGSIFIGVTTGVLSMLLVVVVLWWIVDVLISPGFWCHNLCPTGFLLEQVGRFSLVRLRKIGEEPCPPSCNLCERECPYRLQPKHREHQPSCDNCGRCASVCPSDRLKRTLPDRVGRRLPVVGGLLLVTLLALPTHASAHHNKGLPHYGYYENYPQVPTDEYVEIHDQWEIGATIFNFQGYDLRRTSDTPNDIKIYLYLYDLHADQNYVGPVDIEIRKDGEVVARYERTEVDEESIYSTRETLPETGEYQLVCLFDGHEVAFDFFVDLNDGVDWATIGVISLPVLLVFILAMYGRKKKRRRRRRRRRKKRSAATTAIGLAVVASARAGEALAQVAPADCASGDGLRQVLTDTGPMVVMSGLPPWLFIVSVVAILFSSFAVTEWLGPRMRTASTWRRNLIKKPKVYRVVKSRLFQAVPQTFMVGVLAYLIYVGLSGSRVANLAPVAVWTIWWAGLIFTVLVLGASWCFVCPWDGLANLFTRLRIAAKVEPLGLGFRFPKKLANLYPAIALFVGLTWLELGWGVTSNPRATAYLGLAMAALAITFALLFDGKKFCAHLCPVGRICGLYGNFAPVEIRARNPKVCARCTTEDCLNGNEQGYACPTGISLKVVQEATDCTMCTECIKSCDKNNVAFNLRPFGADLRAGRVPRTDEAWLALVLLALTLFHGLSMTATWESFEPGQWSYMKWVTATVGLPRVVGFTLGMAVATAIPIALHWLACRLAAHWVGGVSAQTLFVRYALALLPVALFYHLAHNLMHLLMEGQHVVPLLSDPLGRGADYFGTADLHPGALISESTLWFWQVALILVGHVVGILVAHRVGHRMHPERAKALKSLTPVFVAMVVVSIAGLGLMHLDMNMRLGRM